ncbi:multidrug ABC transporter ATP-binding protein [Burkholderia pyrrocinia]|uniref:Multidrug ABC transporter ATP-binding protein n=1 Tax=Burkholderia pyrrocinia TaxID=60550 RepID=A0A2Z5MSV9_BURPY|nr:sugar ABC transporter ATP-binding protein [Burkholderia pyrrocinia]AXF20403.1 multidrug ABC transporter ATP-binding protein [Burkholderia pyrrocinia]
MNATAVADNHREGAADRPALAVSTHSLCKSFGSVRVLKDVSLQVPTGDSRALVGRNGAGKSTLVAMLTGLFEPTSGTVEFGGRPAPALNNRNAWRETIACVYQRWTIIPTLSVGENLLLNRQNPNGGAWINWRRSFDYAADVLRSWGLDVNPNTPAWRLSVEQRQIVEIGRALLQGSRLLVLDEPTAELERREVSRLFDRIKALQESGITFMYISHHLEEIYEICQSVSVMRDGELVADSLLEDMPKASLVEAMVGASGTALRRSSSPPPSDAVPVTATIEALSLKDKLDGVSFTIRQGECLGVAGLAGSGKDELGEVIAGLRTPDAGVIRLDGKQVPMGDPVGARKCGVGFVPRDRHEAGLLPQLSIAENITVSINDTFGWGGFISPRRQAESARQLMDSLGVVASSQSQPIGELSGGNQQKGMVGRALAPKPKLLVLASPTQGVDIASKEALFSIVERARAQGTSVLVISDDLDELAVCSRVHVLFRGRLTHTFDAGYDEHKLVAAIEGL